MSTLQEATCDTDPRRALATRVVAIIPGLRGFARHLAGDRHHAEELVREAVGQAISPGCGSAHDAPLRPWMFTVLRERFYADGRARPTEPAAYASWLGQHGAGRRTEMETALTRLPPHLIEALMLTGPAGFDLDEAGEICGSSAESVEALTMQARIELRLMLGVSADSLAAARPADA